MNTFNKQKKNLFVIGFVILYFILVKITGNPHIAFLGNMLLMGIIVAKAKFSYFTLKALVLNYVALPIYFQFTTGRSYGILQVTKMHLYYSETMGFLFIYNVLTLLWLINTSMLKKEKELLQSEVIVTKSGAIICSIIAILAALIAFPTVPFVFSTGFRFSALLPGKAWNHLALVALLFASKQIRQSLIVKISTFFTIFWFLAHFERVDIIGFLLTSLVVYLSFKEIKINIRTVLTYGTITFFIVMLMVFLGEVRSSGYSGISLLDILRKMVIQNTASDIGYVFNSGVTYYYQEGLLKGYSYLTYIVESIPLLNSDLRIDLILRNLYQTPGGAFLLNEPLMNFGVVGIIGFQLVEFSLLKILISKVSGYRYFVYVFLMMTVFRTSWYGLFYIETAMIYFIPILYWISKLSKKGLQDLFKKQRFFNQGI